MSKFPDLGKPHSLPAVRPVSKRGRRMYPVSQAELFGVELRRRCGPCILWILSLLAIGFMGSSIIDGVHAISKVASDSAVKEPQAE